MGELKNEVIRMVTRDSVQSAVESAIRRGVSQSAIAQGSGISKQHLWKFLNGHNVSEPVLRAVSAWLREQGHWLDAPVVSDATTTVEHALAGELRALADLLEAEGLDHKVKANRFAAWLERAWEDRELYLRVKQQSEDKS